MKSDIKKFRIEKRKAPLVTSDTAQRLAFATINRLDRLKHMGRLNIVQHLRI